MTSPANSTPVAAAWRRRLAVLLAVAVALVTVRGMTCTDAMATHMPPSASMSMTASVSTAAAGPQADASATTPSRWCPAPATAAGRSTTDPMSCMQASATAAASLTGAIVPGAVRDVWYASAAPTAPRPVVAAVLRHAATLHQIGLLRT